MQYGQYKINLKRSGRRFQVYPNAMRFNLLPSIALVGFAVFVYFDISVNSMTNRAVLKVPKIA